MIPSFSDGDVSPPPRVSRRTRATLKRSGTRKSKNYRDRTGTNTSDAASEIAVAEVVCMSNDYIYIYIYIYI